MTVHVLRALSNARSACNKLDELHVLNEQNVDVCCVTKTWLTCGVPDSLICPEGYRVFKRDGSTPVGGEAAVFATRCSAIAERPRCRVRYSFGKKWKTGIGRQYFTDIIGLSLTTVI